MFHGVLKKFFLKKIFKYLNKPSLSQKCFVLRMDELQAPEVVSIFRSHITHFFSGFFNTGYNDELFYDIFLT